MSDNMHEESQTVNADFLYDGTGALWRAVIDNLPEEIKCNVSASAGKAYIHIKPKSAHLGVGCGEWVNLVFVQSGCPVELYVTDPEADDEDDEYNLYTDEEFEIIPDYGMMNMEEAEENYCDEEDREQLEEYTAYLDVKMGDDHGRLTNKGIKSAWERLKSNEVNCENFVPAVMQYVMNEEGNPQAFLRGTQVEDITMVFYIDIPENEDFNPSKLDFINIDACYDDNSEVLSELLADDLVLLNAVIYDGKMYFADGYDDITEDYDGDCYYDIVDEDVASV